MLLWLLPDQDYPHDLEYAKKMVNQTDPYWENGPRR